MATIRAYTTIEQSRKLAEILPLESADMYYEEVCNLPKVIVGNYILHNLCMEDKDYKKLSNPVLSPAWSFAVLLSIIPKRIKDYNVLRIDISKSEFAIWYDEIGYGVNNNLPDITMESAVDACYEMILKLNKLNLL